MLLVLLQSISCGPSVNPKCSHFCQGSLGLWGANAGRPHGGEEGKNPIYPLSPAFSVPAEMGSGSWGERYVGVGVGISEAHPQGGFILFWLSHLNIWGHELVSLVTPPLIYQLTHLLYIFSSFPL